LLKRIRIIPVLEEKTEYKKLKVAAYCRVSTKEESQLSSYEIQQKYYADLIKNNPDWDFAGIYGDHGKSGLRIDERDGLNKMMQKVLEGEIDLILMKSISRISRNILNTLLIIEQLKERNVNMYFEKEDLNTADDNADLMISIMASLAQEENRNMSENIKWGYKRRFEKGKTLSKYKNFMGYTCVNDELVVIPEQAEIVNKIFELYLEGMTLKQIKDYLEEKCIKTVTGKGKWHITTIDNMLSNEKYMGDSILQKTCSVDFLSKKRVKNDGIVDRYYVAKSHPAIISKKMFKQVQKEKAKRARFIKNADGTVTVSSTKYNGKYLLENLLVCGDCGVLFRRRTERGKVMWRCATRIEKGRESCANSPSLEEKMIQNVVMQAISNIADVRTKYEQFDEKIVRQLVQSIRIVSKDKVIIKLKTDEEIIQRMAI